MLIEIPEIDVIFNVILAFIIGIVCLYTYIKIRPFLKIKNEIFDTSQAERLEYYERQLIDVKIRLDAFEMQGIEQKTDEDPNQELKQFLIKLAKNEIQQEPAEKETVAIKSEDVTLDEKEEEPVRESTPNVPNIVPTNLADYVLHLITGKDMTSRDIQITLKKSREHTSRLMKKLFVDGYVQRNTESKPYTYSITEKGLAKVKQENTAKTIAE